MLCQTDKRCAPTQNNCPRPCRSGAKWPWRAGHVRSLAQPDALYRVWSLSEREWLPLLPVEPALHLPMQEDHAEWYQARYRTRQPNQQQRAVHRSPSGSAARSCLTEGLLSARSVINGHVLQEVLRCFAYLCIFLQKIATHFINGAIADRQRVEFWLNPNLKGGKVDEKRELP